MASKEVEIEENTSELKHLRFLKEIAVKFLVLVSNVYDFAKKNAGDLETKIVSVENAVVSVVRPVYNKLKDLTERIIVFVDDKLEKYAPGLAKKLIAIFQSLIDKTIPLVEKLLTKALSIVTPLITTAISLLKKIIKTIISLLQKIIAAIKSLLQKIIAAIKSLPLYGKLQALLEKGLNAIKSLPIVTKVQDLLQTGLTAIKSAVGRIPLVGNVAQILITNPLALVDLVKNSPVLGVVKNFAKQVETVGLKATLKAAYLSFNVVGPPVIAQFWYKANTYPLFHSLAEVSLPVIEKSSEYYNKFVKYMDGKGYELFDYLPILPINEIKAAYKVVKIAMDSAAAVGDLAGGITGGLTGLDNNNNEGN